MVFFLIEITCDYIAKILVILVFKYCVYKRKLKTDVKAY